MMTTCKNALTGSWMVSICVIASLGQAPPEIKAKLDAKIKQLAVFSTDSEIVKEVKAHEATPAGAEAAAMTNEKWHGLTLLDPFVRTTGKTGSRVRLTGAGGPL